MAEAEAHVDRRAQATSWRRRKLAANSAHLALRVLPLIYTGAIALYLNHVVPIPQGRASIVGRFIAIAASAMVALIIFEKLARRLLPLTTLLRLSLVFPDRAPSRFKMALKAGSGKRMERELVEARIKGLSDTPGRAAEQLILLSTAIVAHDRRTRGHSERVRLYAELVGQELRLSPQERAKLQWAALIHDVGKITVPAEILNKRGRPNDAEWEILQSHPANGERLAAPVAEWLGEWAHAIGGHHERWDGSGYPRGLRGNEIPRAAAIVAVADSFEVMTAVRSYKTAMPLTDGRAELTRCAGTHFSPDIVRAFLNISLPKLRRAGGVAASLAHLPFVGRLLSATAKAPQAWGYGVSNVAQLSATGMASAAMTGFLAASVVHAAPPFANASHAIASDQPSAPATTAAVSETDAGQSATTASVSTAVTSVVALPPATTNTATTAPSDDTADGSPRSAPSVTPTVPTPADSTPTTTAPSIAGGEGQGFADGGVDGIDEVVDDLAGGDGDALVDSIDELGDDLGSLGGVVEGTTETVAGRVDGVVDGTTETVAGADSDGVIGGVGGVVEGTSDTVSGDAVDDLVDGVVGEVDGAVGGLGRGG